MVVWGHDGCDARYRVKLTSCPRHPGTQMKEVTMPKITRFGGHTNAGLTAKDGGFTDDTVTTSAKAAQKATVAPPESEVETEIEQDDEPEHVGAPFDPSELSVADVKVLLADTTPAERLAVLELERRGKNRQGLVGT